MNKLLVTILFTAMMVPVLASAQDAKPTEYTLLAPIPLDSASGDVTTKTTAVQYITGLFRLIIGLAGALAVVMLIYAGIKYMSTDAFSGKNEAKEIIENTLWGLGLVIASWLILYTINPKLVEINFNIEKLPIATSTPPWLGGGGTIPTPSPSLSHQEAYNKLTEGGIKIAGAPNLAGVKEIVVNEIINLKSSCGCEVVLTSATGGSHNPGTCSHANGYKVDLRNKNEGRALTDYITKNFTDIGYRSDGAKMYKSPSGALYGLESNHWDVTKCQ
ncbi:MAG: hypothetical protein A3F53_01285 [Candidatus Zambryskibacteria bacterium RIFCSPHIGHO2_12_FULL_48_10]|uniref:Peptidase M15A C-terminal domain-containing protein n=1 Tax=Candidatus Zambryskibacteria bacterium RIFCSPHIGHO2_01_FULL_46_25 TaxID=1802738 RepID=A0A1G2SZ85_9BACT|nr:MAG: hypothetical protein UX71_C0002G0239 [Parcubacteria group bacterium GW2011_GWA1_47_10]OHA90048.1 MAG: hypothetical protein A2838_00210 [Candidatus Zambryskibacteria bacterium RIFCSPHIGHO2_01_FULL_46_25]OHB00716.1 MAG: hypothetical protein A3F53_01285 [Candidatus Zambryskibacteria bacterium RIFCSPHIGHO2_12_FULL_48_10]OHB06577.1 MAG: hypothetical protein A3A31_03045 [Candidatus Zambryskibacteria bacterium RIFCSPLOWO2_01_FULL_48_25]